MGRRGPDPPGGPDVRRRRRRRRRPAHAGDPWTPHPGRLPAHRFGPRQRVGLPGGRLGGELLPPRGLCPGHLLAARAGGGGGGGRPRLRRDRARRVPPLSDTAGVGVGHRPPIAPRLTGGRRDGSPASPLVPHRWCGRVHGRPRRRGGAGGVVPEDRRGLQPGGHRLVHRPRAARLHRPVRQLRARPLVRGRRARGRRGRRLPLHGPAPLQPGGGGRRGADRGLAPTAGRPAGAPGAHRRGGAADLPERGRRADGRARGMPRPRPRRADPQTVDRVAVAHRRPRPGGGERDPPPGGRRAPHRRDRWSAARHGAPALGPLVARPRAMARLVPVVRVGCGPAVRPAVRGGADPPQPPGGAAVGRSPHRRDGDHRPGLRVAQDPSPGGHRRATPWTRRPSGSSSSASR